VWNEAERIMMQSMQRQSIRARLVDSTSAAQSTELSARRQTDQPWCGE